MHTHEKYGHHFHRKALEDQGCRSEKHHGNFKPFDANGNGPFAETIGKVAAGHGEKNERQCKKCSDNRNQGVAFLSWHAHTQNDKEDQVLERQVAKGTLELGDNQAPERAPPGLLLRRGRGWLCSQVCSLNCQV